MSGEDSERAVVLAFSYICNARACDWLSDLSILACFFEILCLIALL